jgi:hypothetical protein
LDNNVTVVTEPDYWFGKQESVFLVGCDNWTVEQYIKELPKYGDYSLHIGEQNSKIDWIVNTATRSTVVIVSNEYENKIVTGYLMSMPNVWWCDDIHHEENYEGLNNRKLTVPVDWILKKRLINDGQ